MHREALRSPSSPCQCLGKSQIKDWCSRTKRNPLLALQQTCKPEWPGTSSTNSSPKGTAKWQEKRFDSNPTEITTLCIPHIYSGLEQELFFSDLCTSLHSRPAHSRGTRMSTSWMFSIVSVTMITASLVLGVYEKYLAVKILRWKNNYTNQLPQNLTDTPQKEAQFIGKEALNQLPAQCKQEQGHLAEGIFLFMLMSEYLFNREKWKPDYREFGRLVWSRM